jgi:hypothetical protein
VSSRKGRCYTRGYFQGRRSGAATPLCSSAHCDRLLTVVHAVLDWSGTQLLTLSLTDRRANQ